MKRERFAAHESEFLSEIARGMGWEIFYDQLQPGRFAGAIEYAETGGARFYHEHYNRALRVHGAVPLGMTTFLLPSQRPEGATFCGGLLTPQTVCAFTPGDQGALCTLAGHDYITCCFATERIESACRVLSHITLSRVLPHTTSFSVPVEFVARLHVAARAAFAVQTASDQILDAAAATRAIEERALAELCCVLTAGDPPPRAPLAARNHWHCVRAVRDYAAEHLGEALGIETLCRIARVSERTLNTAFRAVLGVSPQQFIKARRLTAARQALTRAGHTGTPVKSVALSLGFWHFGYFARDYKAHFGESPSQTLGASVTRFNATPRFSEAWGPTFEKSLSA